MSALTLGSPSDERDPGPADLRLVPAAAGAWLAAALGTRVGVAVAATAALAATAAAVAVVCKLSGRRWRAGAAAVLLCTAGSLMSAAIQVSAVRQGPVPSLAADRAAASVTAVVTGDPRVVRSTSPFGGRRQLVVVPVRAVDVTAAGVRTRVRTPLVVLATGVGWEALLPSQRLTASGRLGPSRDGEAVAVLQARGPPSAVDAPNSMNRVAGRMRSGLHDAVRSLPAEERGLLPGLVVGDTSRLDPGLVDDFRTTGMTHLVAVSGLIVVLTGGCTRRADEGLDLRSGQPGPAELRPQR